MKAFSLKIGLVKLHYLCNQDCVFCWHHQFGDKINGASYSLERFKKLLVDAKELGIDTIGLSGGEPLIHKDLKHFVELVYRNEFNLALATNGSLLKYKNYVKFLKKKRLKYVHFSFYSHNPAIHAKITDSLLFEHSVQGLINLLKNDIEVLVNVVIHNYTIKSLTATIDYLFSLGVKNLKLNIVEPTGNVKKNEEIIPDLKLAVDSKKTAIEYAEKLGMNVIFDGFPLCFVKGFEDNYKDISSTGIKYISEAFEDKFYPTHHGNRTKFDVCEGCSKKKLCDGLYTTYLDYYKVEEMSFILRPYN